MAGDIAASMSPPSMGLPMVTATMEDIAATIIMAIAGMDVTTDRIMPTADGTAIVRAARAAVQVQVQVQVQVENIAAMAVTTAKSYFQALTRRVVRCSAAAGTDALIGGNYRCSPKPYECESIEPRSSGLGSVVWLNSTRDAAAEALQSS